MGGWDLAAEWYCGGEICAEVSLFILDIEAPIPEFVLNPWSCRYVVCSVFINAGQAVVGIESSLSGRGWVYS